MREQMIFMSDEFLKAGSQQKQNFDSMMDEIVQQWKEPLGTLMNRFEREEIEKEKTELDHVRTWLSAALPDQDHTEAKSKRPMLLGDWLLDHETFKDWKDSPKSSIIWMHGFAGTGKTNLSRRVISSMRREPEELEEKSSHITQDEPFAPTSQFVSTPKNTQKTESANSIDVARDVPTNHLPAELYTKEKRASSSENNRADSHSEVAQFGSEKAGEGESNMEPGRLAFFYCSNDKGGSGREEVFSRSDPEEALRSIVSQLAIKQQDRSIAEKLREKWEDFGPGSDERRILNYSDCVEVILSISADEPITIVIDALDECDHGKCVDFVEKLKEIVRRTSIDKSSHPVKVFVATRPFPAIEKELNSSLSLEVTEENNRKDVRTFISKTLDERSDDLLLGNASAELKIEIENTLAKRAQNMFLYASLLLNQLCDRSHYNDEESIRKKLQELPSTLKDVYDHVMEKIHDDRNNSLRHCYIAQNTLKLLLRTQEPLHCDVILEAASTIGEQAKSEEILQWCRTLVVKAKTTFEFAHYSIREYLEKKAEYNPSQCHLVATQSCLRILNTSFELENSNGKLSDTQHAFSRYALLYWPVHYEGIELDDIDPRREDVTIMLRNFLLQGHGKTDKYTDWLSQARTMAHELSDKKSLSLKLDSLEAKPPTPLFAACVFGFPDIIGRFGRDLHGLNKCNLQGQSALSLAIENNKFGTVKALLTRRFPANVNLLNVRAVEQFEQFDSNSPPPIIHYASPLQAAAACGFQEIAEHLIEKGAHIDLVAGYYGSALQAAALNGHARMVSLLLNRGAEPNSQGGYYGNALQAAAAKGHVDVINLLLENQNPALVSTPGGPFGSALMAAVCSGSSEAAWMILLDEGADPNQSSKVHGSPLEKAASMGFKEVVNLLLDKDATADLKPRKKPLHVVHHAAMYGIIELARYCLDRGCAVDMITTDAPKFFPRPIPEDPKKMTPLSLACAKGRKEMVKFLLGRKASLELGDVSAAALWVTVQQNHADIVDLLIDHFEATHSPADSQKFVSQCPPHDGFHPLLFIAVWTGNERVVGKLLDKKSRYANNWYDASPLLATATFNKPKITKILLDYSEQGHLNGDLNIDAQARNKHTALFEACHFSKNHLDVAQLLLDAGADWSIPDEFDATPLHMIVCGGDNRAFAAVLLDKARKNTDILGFKKFLNTQNRFGRTALMDAVNLNRLSCIELLLEYGADWSICNNSKVTPLHAASWEGHDAVLRLLLNAAQDSGEKRCKEFLNCRNDDGKTALLDAVVRDRPSFVKLLLQKGADYSIPNKRNETALHCSSFAGKEGVTAILLEKASQEIDEARFKRFLNFRNDKGKTALMDAAETDRTSIIKLLLDKDADYAILDNDGFTALHYGVFRNKTRASMDCLLAKASQDTTDNGQRFKDFLNHKGHPGDQTAVKDAVWKGHKEMVDLLLNKYGAAYDCIDKEHCSILHHGYARFGTSVAEMILAHAANHPDKQRFRDWLQVKDFRNKTVWELTDDWRDEGMKQLMRKYGAV